MQGLVQIHQKMKADEEYKALKAESTKRGSMTAQQLSMNRSVCLVALAHPHQGESQPEGVVGTLDLYAVRALEGEVLIGKCCSPTITRCRCMFILLQLTQLLHHPTLGHVRP